MPIRIETTITRESRSQFDPARPIVLTGYVSDDHDYYLGRSEILYSRGRKRLEMRPSAEGQAIRETTIVYGDELDAEGQLVEHASTRETVLREIGDSFEAHMQFGAPGQLKTTHDIVFTKVERAETIEDTESSAA